MQNPWFPLYVADYLAKTSHLSQAQHGAYMLLMMHYYATLKPIPADAGVLQRVCKAFAPAEMDDVRTILDTFFTLDGNCYRHERIDEEIAKRSDISTKRRNAAHKRHQDRPMQMHTQSQSQSQSQVKEEPKAKGASAFELPEWVPQEAWNHYEEMRKKIRKPMTDQARIWAVRMLEKLKKQGHQPTAVLEQSVFNSWQGLFEVRNDSNTQAAGRNTADNPGGAGRTSTQVTRAYGNLASVASGLTRGNRVAERERGAGVEHRALADGSGQTP